MIAGGKAQYAQNKGQKLNPFLDKNLFQVLHIKKILRLKIKSSLLLELNTGRKSKVELFHFIQNTAVGIIQLQVNGIRQIIIFLVIDYKSDFFAPVVKTMTETVITVIIGRNGLERLEINAVIRSFYSYCRLNNLPLLIDNIAVDFQINLLIFIRRATVQFTSVSDAGTKSQKTKNEAETLYPSVEKFLF
jgi:hypothetical protein